MHSRIPKMMYLGFVCDVGIVLGGLYLVLEERIDWIKLGLSGEVMPRFNIQLFSRCYRYQQELKCLASDKMMREFSRRLIDC